MAENEELEMAGHEQIKKLRRRTFTLEFKIEVVKLKRDQNLTYIEVGRWLDILPKLIQRWDKRHEAGELRPGKAKRRISPEQQEISELRAQLSRLKMENANSKMAAAYFARKYL